MNKSIRILCAFLAAFTITAVACSEKQDEPASDTVATVAADADIVTEETQLQPSLPESDFEDYNFRVITKGHSSSHWNSKDIYAEEINGDPINDAVYNRNLKIGDKYGFFVTEIETSGGTWNVYGDVQKSVHAQSDDYDMSAGGLTGDFTNLLNSDMLVNLHDIQYMDLTKPWYDQNANAQISIANRLYATVGDMLIMDNDATYGVLFNKAIANDFQYNDFYDRVRDKTWTLDYMTECILAVTADLDGDGDHDEHDRWGVEGEPFNSYAYVVGTGETTVKKDADDLPYFVLENERFYDAFAKAVRINRDFDICLFSDNITGYSDVWSEVIDLAFIEDRLLFTVAGLNRVTLFRTMEGDFGILPMPMMDENQDDYNVIVSIACANSIQIPVTASDLDRTGIIIEALSAESMYTLTPAYYDVSVKGKGTRDNESEEMLDLIMANRVYDLGYMFDWGSIIGSVNGLADAGKIASTIQVRVKAANKAMEKTVALFTE